MTKNIFNINHYLPIIWRYLLVQYFKVLFFCIFAFVAILLTTRLDDIAHFATMGPEGSLVLKFTLYQIPYILPIAIPIACLISSLLLVQRLCSTHELTALRAAGLSLGNVFAPLLLAGLLLAFTNFYVVSELTTHSHLSSSLLKKDLRSINPLLLLNNKHLMRVKGFFFNSTGASKVGEFASNIEFATPNRDNSRINLLIGKKITASPDYFIGEDVTLITSLGKSGTSDYDNLMIENIGKVTTTIQDFTQMVEKKMWNLNNDYLPWALLLVRAHEEKEALVNAKKENRPVSEEKQIIRRINRIYAEIVRRVSVGMSAFCFTLMGIAFGLSISRNHSSKGIIIVVLLAALYLVCFFVAKGIDHHLAASVALYTLPLVVIIGLSVGTIRRISKGVE